MSKVKSLSTKGPEIKGPLMEKRLLLYFGQDLYDRKELILVMQ